MISFLNRFSCKAQVIMVSLGFTVLIVGTAWIIGLFGSYLLFNRIGDPEGMNPIIVLIGFSAFSCLNTLFVWSYFETRREKT